MMNVLTTIETITVYQTLRSKLYGELVNPQYTLVAMVALFDSCSLWTRTFFFINWYTRLKFKSLTCIFANTHICAFLYMCVRLYALVCEYACSWALCAWAYVYPCFNHRCLCVNEDISLCMSAWVYKRWYVVMYIYFFLRLCERKCFTIDIKLCLCMSVLRRVFCLNLCCCVLLSIILYFIINNFLTISHII